MGRKLHWILLPPLTSYAFALSGRCIGESGDKTQDWVFFTLVILTNTNQFFSQNLVVIGDLSGLKLSSSLST